MQNSDSQENCNGIQFSRSIGPNPCYRVNKIKKKFKYIHIGSPAYRNFHHRGVEVRILLWECNNKIRIINFQKALYRK